MQIHRRFSSQFHPLSQGPVTRHKSHNSGRWRSRLWYISQSGWTGRWAEHEYTDEDCAFRHNWEKTWSARECKYNGRYNSDGRGKGWIANDFVVRDPDSINLWCSSTVILDANCNDDNKNWRNVWNCVKICSQESALVIIIHGSLDPCKPGDSTQCSNTSKAKSYNSENGDKYSSACAVGWDCIQTNRYPKNTRFSIEYKIDAMSVRHFSIREE